MNTFERRFLAANRWVLIVMLAAMALIIFANVALRYLTDQSIEWAEEVARHLMIWLTFVGAGPVLRYGGHIAVDNLQDGLPRAAAIGLRVLISVLRLGFFGFMVWYGTLYVLRAQYQTTAATQISFAYVYAAMPIGGVLLIVHWLLIVRDYLRARVFASDAHFDANASASL
ncbi:MAG TPA: TRAP transporter small permease [Albitalea sp.]|jgi:TRAP-type C4-dicarboxylate transport system permease small subunit|nr:TRAP transporter small permease [Albitalea sp.]